MAEGQVPEAWIGREVEVGVRGSSRHVHGVLAQVNDRGIALVAYAADLDDEDAQGAFYPWRFVQGIRAKQKGSGAQEGGQEIGETGYPILRGRPPRV